MAMAVYLAMAVLLRGASGKSAALPDPPPEVAVAAAVDSTPSTAGEPTPSTASDEQHPPTPPTKAYLVRMLWVRHGLSCANVLDNCLSDGANLTAVVAGNPQLAEQIDGVLKGELARGRCKCACTVLALCLHCACTVLEKYTHF
jgi:hypothetical protein